MQVEDDADPSWVAGLTLRSLAVAESAVEEARADGQLFRHLAREHARTGRSSYIEIDAPLELHAIARLLRPEHVVEVGVSSGVSSAYLLAALERNGRGTLHSVDLPARPSRTANGRGASWSLPPGKSSGWAVPRRLCRGWDLRLGDKVDVVPTLARELRRVDLVVYDVPHNEADLVREFAELDPRMPRGAVAIVDHGPGGGLCLALRRWARSRGTTATRRAGLGLYGIRCGPADHRNRPTPREATHSARPWNGGVRLTVGYPPN
ncbi:MAG TPA: class I SAM-dependent methyltransferase [Thermoplasmata archaeon]|nr:class I SAM-dependent methyltransferase [Thermoplasmata archaeon]